MFLLTAALAASNGIFNNPGFEAHFERNLSTATREGRERPEHVRMDGQTFQLSPDRAGVLHLTAGLIDRLLNSTGGSVRVQGYRWDSASRTYRKWDSAHGRYDSGASPTAGLYFARQLEHIYREVLREPHPPLNGLDGLPADRSVPLGAKTHTVRRLYAAGDATIHGGGQTPLPVVSLSAAEQQFPVKYLLSSIAIDYFEKLAGDFANLNSIKEMMDAARRSIEELTNRLIFEGSATHGLYGIFNYPWLDKTVWATTMSSSTSADDMLVFLNYIASYPQLNSRMTFSPDTLALSPRLHNLFATKARASGTDTTVLKFWLKTNSAGIKKVLIWQELQAAGPSSTDGAFVFRAEGKSISVVQVAPFSTLAMETYGLNSQQICWSAYGGVIMRDVGNNLLAWVTYSD